MAPENWAQRLAADNPFLLRELRIWIRRALNEGVGAYILAMFLITAAAIALRVYVRDLAALDAAMTREVTQLVRTEQEPLDTVRRVGLVSAALAALNAEDEPQTGTAAQQSNGVSPGNDASAAGKKAGWTCDEKDQACQALNFLMEEVPTVMANMNLERSPMPEIPTADASCLPPDVGHPWTYLMMPRQLAPISAAANVSDRVRTAVRLSAALDVALDRMKERFAIARTDLGMPSSSRLVQAYFISPDSVLRIWTRASVSKCETVFPQTRLWAAKAYFNDLWESPISHTRAYIDYGGNGLVKTYCTTLTRPGTHQQDLEELGALCADLRIDLRIDRSKIMDHLFFQTARLSIPDGPVTDPNAIVVDDGDGTAGDTWSIGSRVSHAAIRKAVLEKLPENRQASAPMHRDISTISADGRDAFLLPVSGTGSSSDYVLFIPRSPQLPWWDQLAGGLGLLLVGVACASALYGRQLARSTTQSRNRLDLLRNLQVGVVQVDRKDRILGANDRAEEIFGRPLPKFADRQTGPSVNFARLIEPAVWRIPVNGGGLVSSSLGEENEARSAGQFSAYFAQLRGTAPTRWIRVSATPMLLAHSARGGVDSARVSTVFATVDEVSDVERVDLEERTNGGGKPHDD